MTMPNESYTEANAKIIDAWVDAGWEWGAPVSHETWLRAQAGEWDVVLTPTRPVPKSWFPPMAGARVLGLASGGGQQMPIFAALGAVCTVMDYSPRQLASERMVAAREGYAIDTVRADMTQPFPFADASFDMIFHPVSNCYIQDVEPVWRECFRVLRPGGRLLAGLDNGINYLFEDESLTVSTRLPWNPLADPELYRKSLEEGWGIQFSHTIEEQLGGQLRAGLMLRDIFHDINHTGPLAGYNVPTFYATLAIRPE